MFPRKFCKQDQNSRENSKSFWRWHLWRESVECLLSNGEGFKDIQHSMSTVLELGFHMWFIMTIYYKIQQLFYFKMRQKFITGFLLENVTVLLQNARVMYYKLRRCITKCDSCCKMRRLLEIATIESISKPNNVYVATCNFSRS